MSCSGGHYWNYYTGTLSLSQFMATHLKIIIKSIHGNSFEDGVSLDTETRSAQLQIMAWGLIGAKPLPEPLLTYCQLHSEE